MKKLAGFSAWFCLVLCGVGVAAAQEPGGSGAESLPPKVLVIQREFLKPGKAGSLHKKSESAFVQAMTAAKWPTRYLAVESLSGRSRALFLIGFPSFDAWEKDNEATEKNAAFSAAMDRASIADGELLTEYESSAWVYRDDFSLRPDAMDIPHMRYFEISSFRVRPGHTKEWESLVAMYRSGYEKGVPNARWAVFESMYGAESSGTYLVFLPMKSLVEVDQGFGDSKKFVAALGEDGMKKLAELSASCIESAQTNLFSFSPRMSYPREEWVKADPEFWKPMRTAPTASMKKAAATTP
ncbi:MAG TPA: hypothetical protein VK627_04085 [Edaphobacter sp.]|nr:hypothetical protein [Edaphobacter sp.]